MEGRTFALWLQEETVAARCALLALYEQRDKLLLQDGPRLEQAYLDAIGPTEEPVIVAEMECELLRRKQEMIQAARNRREPIDLAAIDAAIDGMRQQMIREAAEAGPAGDYIALSAEQAAALQELYHRIVSRFHPQVHPELTAAHRALFTRAQDAYRRRDLPALQLIYDMLTGPQEDAQALLQALLAQASAGASASAQALSDYTLAAQVYGCFRPTAEERALHDELDRCRAQADGVTAEIDGLRTQFPYSAADMLADPAQVEAYKQGLVRRLHAAGEEHAQRLREIEALLGEVRA